MVGTLNLILGLIDRSEDFSSLPKELRKSKYYAELLKEYIIEDVRAREFPEKPSRKSCMFLIPIEMYALSYAKRLGFSDPKKTFWELELQNCDVLHFADINLLNCKAYSHEEKVMAARNYWTGTANRDANTEVLFKGKFKVIRQLALSL